MRQYYPSKHAVQVMGQRHITWDEVLFVLEAPEVQYINTPRQGERVRGQVSQRGQLYVVTSLTPTLVTARGTAPFEMFAVVTCGLRRSDQWNNEEVRARERKALPSDIARLYESRGSHGPAR